VKRANKRTIKKRLQQGRRGRNPLRTTLKFVAKGGGRNNNENCIICYCKLYGEEDGVVGGVGGSCSSPIPPFYLLLRATCEQCVTNRCNNVFHKDCLDTWKSRNQRSGLCPLCKGNKIGRVTAQKGVDDVLTDEAYEYRYHPGGETPMIMACRLQDLEFVQALLENPEKAQLELTDSKDNTALLEYIMTNTWSDGSVTKEDEIQESVNIFIELMRFPDLLNMPHYSKSLKATAFFKLVHMTRTCPEERRVIGYSMIEEMLHYDQWLNLGTRCANNIGITALQLALQNGTTPTGAKIDSDDTIANLILDAKCGGENIENVTDSGKTALTLICQKKDVNLVILKKVLKMMQSKNVLNIDHRDHMGKTAFMMVCESGNQPAFEEFLLYAHPGMLTTKDLGGNTPLHLACSSGRWNIIEKFLRFKNFEKFFAEVNEQGNTPFMQALTRRHRKTALKLLKNHPDQMSLAVKNRNDKTALKLAEENQLQDVKFKLERLAYVSNESISPNASPKAKKVRR